MCTGPVLLAWQEDEKEELPFRQRPYLTRNGAEAFFDSEAIRHLCAAIESHDAKELARQLKSKDLEINYAGYGGLNPLHWALLKGNFAAFEMLLKKGANPDARITLSLPGGRGLVEGDSVLMSSVLYGGSRIKYFFAALPYSKLPSQKRICGHTLLHGYFVQSLGLDVSKEGIAKLVKKGVPLDAQDNKGDTALHIAVNGSRPQLCIDLIEVGANPFIKNKAGQDIPARIQSNLKRLKGKQTKATKEDQEKFYGFKKS